VVVDHEVVPEHLKRIVDPAWVNLVVNGAEAISDQAFHLRKKVTHE
jgi:hypothetical protein